MMLDTVIFVLVLLFGIIRMIAQFFKWIGRQAQGLSKSTPAVTAPAPMPVREPLRTISRPAGDDVSLVPQEATRAGFVRREIDLERSEQAARPRVSEEPPPGVVSAPVPSLTALFGSRNDILRAFVMQEVLGPPRRMRPSPPPQSGT